MFTHLHGHSTFSFLDAIGKPKHIVSRAKQLGMEAIAITDFNGMYGSINFYLTANEENIKPIIGVEIGFVLDVESVSNPKAIGNIVLIAKNNEGYHSLMELTSFANQEGIKNKPKIDISILKQKSDGLIAIIGGEDSFIGKMLTNGESEDRVVEVIRIIKDILGKENVYLEMIAQDENILNDTQKINHNILSFSKELGLDCVVNNNYFYPSQEEKAAREMALAIKDGNKMYESNRRKPKGAYHIMSQEEIENVMLANGYKDSQIQDWIFNNEKIAESINYEIKLGQYLFPNYETPEDIKNIYEENKDQLIQ
ncbi:PHP domain-containing protein [Candidatus Gracilibacteria bacterium]|nr:PHP domain-containing protein [Candidatus Gracilibacteria bacterium]